MLKFLKNRQMRHFLATKYFLKNNFYTILRISLTTNIILHFHQCVVSTLKQTKHKYKKTALYRLSIKQMKFIPQYIHKAKKLKRINFSKFWTVLLSG